MVQDIRIKWDTLFANFPRPKQPSPVVSLTDDIKQIYPVVPSILKEGIELTNKTFINVVFSGVVSLPNNVTKDWKLRFWLKVEDSGTIKTDVGHIAFFCAQTLALPFAYLMSDKVKFRRLRFKVFESNKSFSSS